MTSTSSLAGSSLAWYPSSRPRCTGNQRFDHIFEGSLPCLDVVHVGDVRADALDDLPQRLDLHLERVVEAVHEGLDVLGLRHPASCVSSFAVAHAWSRDPTAAVSPSGSQRC